MSRTAKSLVAFGSYAIFMGAWFVIAPGPMLDFLLTARTTEHWIRLLGLSAIVLGFYYITLGRAELALFARLSLWGRIIMASGMCALVIAGIAPVLLLGVAGNELLGVLWTWRALRADEHDGIIARAGAAAHSGAA